MNDGIVKLADEVNRRYAPLQWKIFEILPAGHFLLTGRPKIGKSRLLMSLLLSIAYGEKALVELETKCNDVLLLALEDTPRRIRQRVLSLKPPGKLTPDNFEVAYDWERLDIGGSEALSDWLTTHPNGVIGIDTYTKIRPKPNGDDKDLYRTDYDMFTPLTDLVKEHPGATIISVVHNRKMSSNNAWDEISGSTGIAGAVDGALILRKKTDKTNGKELLTLFVDGRDILDQREYALSFDKATGQWKLEGEAWRVILTEKQQQLIDLIAASNGGMTIAAMVERTGENVHTIRSRVKALKDEERLFMGTGRTYGIVDAGITFDEEPEDAPEEA